MPRTQSIRIGKNPTSCSSTDFLVELKAKFLVAFYMNFPMWIPWHQLTKLRSCLSVFLASSTNKYYPLFPLTYFLKIRRNLVSLRPNVSIQFCYQLSKHFVVVNVNQERWKTDAGNYLNAIFLGNKDQIYPLLLMQH